MLGKLDQFSTVQSLSRVWLCDPKDCSMPGFPVHQLPEFTQTDVHWVTMPPNHIILCHPLLLLPSIFPSIRVFSNESVLHNRWPKYRSFSFSTSPSSEIFRTGFLQDGLVGSPCSPRETQESSLTPHFKRINSSVLSFLYSPTLTSIHATAAKSLQSCPTLWDPIDCSPPGSSVHGILQTRILKQVAISFSISIHDYWKNHRFD